MSMMLPEAERMNIEPQPFLAEHQQRESDFEFELTPLRTTIAAGVGDFPLPCCQCVVGCVFCHVAEHKD